MGVIKSGWVEKDFCGIKCTGMAIYPNKVGMKSHLSRPEFTAQETQLIQQLRQQPEMLTRLQSILDLASTAEGPLKTADEIEALLIQKLRQPGRTSMHQ